MFMLVGCRLLMFMVTLNFVQRSGIHIAIPIWFRVKERVGVLKLESSDTLALTEDRARRDLSTCNLCLEIIDNLHLCF